MIDDLDDAPGPEPIECRMCGPVEPDAGGGHACLHRDDMPVAIEREVLAILDRSPRSAWDHRRRGLDGRDPYFEVIDVELEGWQRSFEIVVVPASDPAASGDAVGPGIAPAMRLVLGHGLTVSSVRTVRR